MPMPEPAPAPVPISMPVPCAPSHACVHDRQVAADLARGGMSPGGMPGRWHVAEDGPCGLLGGNWGWGLRAAARLPTGCAFLRVACGVLLPC